MMVNLGLCGTFCIARSLCINTKYTAYHLLWHVSSATGLEGSARPPHFGRREKPLYCGDVHFAAEESIEARCAPESLAGKEMLD